MRKKTARAVITVGLSIAALAWPSMFGLVMLGAIVMASAKIADQIVRFAF